MSRWTWLEEARGLVGMIGDFGTVNAKDFRIAVEVIQMLIGDYALVCADYKQEDSFKESKRLIEDEVNALAKKLREEP